MNRIIISFLFFLLVFSLSAQEIPFRKWTTDNGLPKNNITSIKQDGQGFLWLENEGGIARFDGTEFKNYKWNEIPKIEKGLSFSSIIGGRDNQIIGLEYGKPYSFSPDCEIKEIGGVSKTQKSFFFHHASSSKDESLGILDEYGCRKFSFKSVQDSLVVERRGENDSISIVSEYLSFSLHDYSNNEVLIHIKNQGIFKVDTEFDSIHLQALVTDFPEIETGIHSRGEHNGVWFVLNGKLYNWGEHYKSYSYNLGAEETKNTRFLQTDFKKGIWVNGLDEIHQYNFETLQSKVLNNALNLKSEVQDLHIDNEGNTWIATKSEGLFCVLNPSFDGFFQQKGRADESKSQARETKVVWHDIILNEEKQYSEYPPKMNQTDKLEVYFGAIAYKNAPLVHYRYRLNPLEDWQSTKNRSLVFSYLQSGQYRLEIQGKSPDSSWSRSLILPFFIEAPFWKQWWFYVLLTFGVLLLAGMILFTIRRRERNRILLNRRFAEMELKALQAQMNPHFIFNTLNAIQYTILKQDLQLAGRSLNDFASLMRLFLESSHQKQVPLSDEIKMLRHYCELTRMCYEGKFNFNIKVDTKIEAEDISIPGMLIQPHVENAIQHGLLPKENKGWLIIQFDMVDKETLRCIIRDDGIGRAASADQRKKSKRIQASRGLTLTQDRVDVLNKIYDTDIEFDIKDLKDKNGAALGTDVVLLIAVD